MTVLFNKFHRRINLVALLLGNSGLRSKTTFSEFRSLEIWRLKVLYIKFAMCGKYSRAWLAHQIFYSYAYPGGGGPKKQAARGPRRPKSGPGYVTHWPLANVWNIPMEITKFRIKFKNFTVDFTRNFSWIICIGSLGRFFRTECFGSKNPKFWITVYPLVEFSSRNFVNGISSLDKSDNVFLW
jgi:hypothetical protein